MRGKIDCFLPCDDMRVAEMTVSQLRANKTIHHIYLLVGEERQPSGPCPPDCTLLSVDRLQSSAAVAVMEQHVEADFVMLFTKSTPVKLGMYAPERLLRVAHDAGAALVYADHFSVENGKTVKHPVIDYQAGSIRDDFDFGSMLLIRSSLLHDYVAMERRPEYQFAGIYDLRLFISRKGTLLHLNEFLYTEEELDLRASGEKQFDYVNPRNREVQVEMEKAATNHLKEIGALVDTSAYATPDFKEQDFKFEASVVIPVFNREKTICDAVDSALSQVTTFDYNVIVVDNHSTDNTTQLL